MRFGVSMRGAATAGEWRDAARRWEDAGFDTLWVADHVGMLDPFVALVAAAGATERVAIGTYVLNVEFWNPLLLARAAATAELLSGGRLVLGLGAGHAEVEFDQAGLRYPPPRERVDRLGRVAAVIGSLLAGETVDDGGLGLKGAATGIPPVRPSVPLLVGGNGDEVLRIAARHADMAGLVGFTSGTGQTHSDLSHWTWPGLEERMRHVRVAAEDAGRAAPAVDVLVQRVVVTDDRPAFARAFADATGTPADAHLDSPHLLLGTEDEIAAQLERLEALGVAGVTVFDHFAAPLTPVVERLSRP